MQEDQTGLQAVRVSLPRRALGTRGNTRTNRNIHMVPRVESVNYCINIRNDTF